MIKVFAELTKLIIFAPLLILTNIEQQVHLKNDCESSSGVEHHLAKVRVAGSNPVFRSITI